MKTCSTTGKLRAYRSVDQSTRQHFDYVTGHELKLSQLPHVVLYDHCTLIKGDDACSCLINSCNGRIALMPCALRPSDAISASLLRSGTAVRLRFVKNAINRNDRSQPLSQVDRTFFRLERSFSSRTIKWALDLSEVCPKVSLSEPKDEPSL